MNYERTVAAALNETQSKFRLAEALALDIPFRGKNGGNEARYGRIISVEKLIEQARKAIIAAGGEPKTVQTLMEYRRVGAWARVGDTEEFLWVNGYSFTAHLKAQRVGVDINSWVANPKNGQQTLREAGQLYCNVSGSDLSSLVDAEIARREALAAEEKARELALMPVRQKVAQARREAAKAFREHADWREAMIVNSGDKSKPANQQLQFWAGNVIKLLESHEENGYYYTDSTFDTLRELSLRIDKVLTTGDSS